PDAPYRDGIDVTVTGADNLNLLVTGNALTQNDTGFRLVTATSGVVNVDLLNNIMNNNVNDGVNVRQDGPGTLNLSLVGTGTLVDSLTGLSPTVVQGGVTTS